jgi:hypothetical protein
VSLLPTLVSYLLIAGPYLFLMLAAVLGGRALAVAGGFRHDLLAHRLRLASLPLALLCILTGALQLFKS